MRIDLNTAVAQAGANLIRLLGGSERARFVGGCVRDRILGRQPKDWDIATTHPWQRVKAILNEYEIEVKETGTDFGTVTAVVMVDNHHYPFEITTLRRDLDTDGRRATVVEYSEDWYEDALRRDFTMNALYAGLEGQVYDPLGTGVQDAENRCVRFVGDARARIGEDYLRILRFFRFNARFGGKIDEESFLACKAMAPGMDRLSRERVRMELWSILREKYAFSTILIMVGAGVTDDILGKNLDIYRYERIMTMSLYNDIWTPACLAALNPDPDIIRGLRFDRETENRILTAMSDVMDLEKIRDLDPKRLQHIAYKYKDAYLAQDVIAVSLVHNFDYLDLFDIMEDNDLFDITVPEFPLQGRDLQEKGYMEGPGIGVILKHLEDKWVKSDFELTRAELVAMIPKPSTGETFSPWTVSPVNRDKL